MSLSLALTIVAGLIMALLVLPWLMQGLALYCDWVARVGDEWRRRRWRKRGGD